MAPTQFGYDIYGPYSDCCYVVNAYQFGFFGAGDPVLILPESVGRISLTLSTPSFSLSSDVGIYIGGLPGSGVEYHITGSDDITSLVGPLVFKNGQATELLSSGIYAQQFSAQGVQVDIVEMFECNGCLFT